MFLHLLRIPVPNDGMNNYRANLAGNCDIANNFHDDDGWCDPVSEYVVSVVVLHRNQETYRQEHVHNEAARVNLLYLFVAVHALNFFRVQLLQIIENQSVKPVHAVVAEYQHVNDKQDECPNVYTFAHIFVRAQFIDEEYPHNKKYEQDGTANAISAHFIHEQMIQVAVPA